MTRAELSAASVDKEAAWDKTIGEVVVVVVEGVMFEFIPELVVEGALTRERGEVNKAVNVG